MESEIILTLCSFQSVERFPVAVSCFKHVIIGKTQYNQYNLYENAVQMKTVGLLLISLFRFYSLKQS